LQDAMGFPPFPAPSKKGAALSYQPTPSILLDVDCGATSTYYIQTDR
jgi:hypothetical protein